MDGRQEDQTTTRFTKDARTKSGFFSLLAVYHMHGVEFKEDPPAPIHPTAL
jgi:hypothetical protein